MPWGHVLNNQKVEKIILKFVHLINKKKINCIDYNKISLLLTYY